MPEDMFQTENPNEYSDEQIREMWPQARGELLGFARALSRNSGITAAQLRMAIQLADEAFRREYPKL